MPLFQQTKPWIGLHGIWDDGSDTVIKLLKRMDVTYYMPKYDVNPFSARLADKLPFIPHDAMSALRPNLICHSAGCLMAKRLMDRGHIFGKIFFFASALDNDTNFPEDRYEKIYNIHYPKDKALFLGSLLFMHPFGSMGRIGYKGKSPNVVNVRASFETTELFNHSNYFLDENIEYWKNYCLAQSS